MSSILLKAVIIIDSESEHHLKKRDILIEKGTISKISNSISNSTAKEISIKNLHVSSGWFDSGVSFGEPGYEDRETIDKGLEVAAKSGFTHVAVNSNNSPVTDTKSGITYFKDRSKHTITSLYPIGALTQKGEGIDLAELYDMHTAGAIGFYDYKKAINNANLVKIALLYAQNFEGLIQSYPMEYTLSKNGMVNEEVNSTRLGLKGIPALSEELQIIRDLYILEYTGGKLHIPTISTQKSVSLIKDAKKKGLDVSCSVSVNNLMLTDDILEQFDTNSKLLPPLRSKKDAKALLKGLEDGTIEGVTSDHNPLTIEEKLTEYDQASFGSIGLESCFGALNKVAGMENSILALTRLKGRFGIEKHSIQEGNKADITLFDPEAKWTFAQQNILSTSKNAVMLDQKLKGKVIGVFAKNKLLLNEV